MLGRSGGVQETRRVDAHFGAPVMRTGCPAYPRARQRLAASPHGRPGRGSRFGLGGERPQVHRCPVRARGRARFHTLVPAPCWGRSPPIILAGRPSAPRRGGGPPFRRPAGLRTVGHGRASFRRRARSGSPLAFPHGIAGPGATPGRVGWPCTSQPSPWRVRLAEHRGRSRQRAQAPARHRRPGGCGTTATTPATCGIVVVSRPSAFLVHNDPDVDVHFRIGNGPRPRAVESRLGRSGSDAMPNGHRSCLQGGPTGAKPTSQRGGDGSR